MFSKVGKEMVGADGLKRLDHECTFYLFDSKSNLKLVGTDPGLSEDTTRKWAACCCTVFLPVLMLIWFLGLPLAFCSQIVTSGRIYIPL